jgi:hypothetical protein
MIQSICLFISLSTLEVDARAGENPLAVIKTQAQKGGTSMTWSDTEDVLRGSVSPAQLRAGKPVTVSVTLGHIQGEELFNGPITFSLRPLGQVGMAQDATVTLPPGQRSWQHIFTPSSAGPHRLELSWNSSRHKVVMSVLDVGEPLLPPWFGLAFGSLFMALFVGLGLSVLFRRADKPS